MNISGAISKVKTGLKKIDAAMKKPVSLEELERQREEKEAYGAELKAARLRNARKKAQIDAGAELEQYKRSKKTPSKQLSNPAFAELGGISGGGESQPFGDLLGGSGSSGHGKKKKGKPTHPFEGLM